jgi:hypothetical protein
MIVCVGLHVQSKIFDKIYRKPHTHFHYSTRLIPHYTTTMQSTSLQWLMIHTVNMIPAAMVGHTYTIELS